MRTKLQPGETVALIVRKHWLVLMKPALLFAAVLLYLPVRHVRILGFEALLNYLLPYVGGHSNALKISHLSTLKTGRLIDLALSAA